MSLTQFYAGVSPKSSDGTEKGVGGDSANKPKYTIPKKTAKKHKKVKKDKVADDGLSASRSRNGKLKDSNKGMEKGPEPTIHKSKKKSEQVGKDKRKDDKTMGKEKGLVPSILKSQKRSENNGKGGSLDERTPKSKPQKPSQKDDLTCESDRNPTEDLWIMSPTH